MKLSRLLKPLVALLVLAGLGYGGYRYLDKASQPEPMALGSIERGDLTLKVTVAGGVVPRRMALITPPYNGYIKRLFLKVGDEVKVGAPVVSIAQTVGTADEEVFPLRSPLTGQVVQVLRAEGEYVNSQTGASSDAAIVRIDDLSKLFVEANVPEIEIAKLEIGQPVLIRVVAVPQKTFNGRILEIARAAKDQDRWERSKVEFPIRIEILDPGPELRSGMSVVLDVIVKEAKDVLTVRHEFVQKEGKTYFVTLGDGTRRDIEVGMQNEDAFEVKRGLTEGDKVRQVDFLQTAGAGPSGRPGGMKMR